ncbi:MAG: DGQHR domain-containing protein [Roseofilum sp. SBFL]|nr:DGQHR domain-containing protein [Roseofilum sp. SID3]MBP0024015.1 DGQHR domain-containing protein [Roseofilum sp. SID2]MBP0039122.1 DGQHR domain-containing protein [Roseofilum sp. SID1]MBP0044502.1 DGQHR domain-containing protein [Roseofilum sp. SBFL]
MLVKQQADINEIINFNFNSPTYYSLLNSPMTLFDELDRHPHQLFVQKTQMGGSQAYLASVTLEWLSNRVRFAHQLPLFQKKIDPQTHNPIRDAETIEQLQQRPLDWSRQAPLAQYLAVRPNHKFPPLLAAIGAPWIEEPYAPEWNGDLATESAAQFTPLNRDQTLGLLNVDPSFSIFALDGQHRLMGIQGLMELIRSGSLPKYKKNKKPTGSSITAEDLCQHYPITPSQLQSLRQETIGLEIIPAVLAGETRDQARSRIRSIFVHVNLMAVRLSAGQLALLNEDDGFSIVARRIAVNHPLLKAKGDRYPRVNFDSTTVSTKSTVLTTLPALKDMAEAYLQHPYLHWKTTEKGLIPLRPEDEELEEALATFSTLFDYLATLPSYQALEMGALSTDLRRFSFESYDGEGHMLFRPVGQIALVRAIGILVYQHHISLTRIFSQLCPYDTQGGFSHIDRSESLWYGILFNPTKKRIQVSGRDLATRLLIHLIADTPDPLDRAQLRQDLSNARTFQDKALNFEGKFVHPRHLTLPEPLG